MSEERLKEQRRKAQKKYWESHRDYYNKQSLNETKRVRIERKTYKQALLDIKEYIETFEEITGITNRYDYRVKEKLLDIVNKALGSEKE